MFEWKRQGVFVFCLYHWRESTLSYVIQSASEGSEYIHFMLSRFFTTFRMTILISFSPTISLLVSASPHIRSGYKA